MEHLNAQKKHSIEILQWINKKIMVLSIVPFRAAYCQYRKALSDCSLHSLHLLPSPLSPLSTHMQETHPSPHPPSDLLSFFVFFCFGFLKDHLTSIFCIYWSLSELSRVWESDKSVHQRQKTELQEGPFYTRPRGDSFPWLAHCFWQFLLRQAGRINPTGFGVLLHDRFLTRPLQLGCLNCIQIGYRVLVRTFHLGRWSSDIELFWCDWIRIRVNRMPSGESASARQI